MRVLTYVLAALGCAAWLGYAFLAALVSEIEGGDGDGQLVIALVGVGALGVAALLAAHQHRVSATLAMLLSAASLVGWLALGRVA